MEVESSTRAHVERLWFLEIDFRGGYDIYRGGVWGVLSLHKVFISHASSDRVAAEKLCRYLESNGLTCWIAPRDIPAGAIWGEAIVDAISRAAIFVVLVSRQSNKSSHVLREVERATSKQKFILPVLLDGEPLEKGLSIFCLNRNLFLPSLMLSRIVSRPYSHPLSFFLKGRVHQRTRPRRHLR
jgi:TIR domain